MLAEGRTYTRVIRVQLNIYHILPTTKLRRVALARYIAALPVDHGVQQYGSAAAVAAELDAEVLVGSVGRGVGGNGTKAIIELASFCHQCEMAVRECILYSSAAS
jgi:hypothetical protein